LEPGVNGSGKGGVRSGAEGHWGPQMEHKCALACCSRVLSLFLHILFA